MIWSGRPLKQQARSFALRDLSPRMHSLWMPAAECICIGEAVKLGILDRSSHIIAVEREEPIYRAMVAQLHKFRFDHVLPLHRELSDVQLTDKLDFVNLDFCGTLTEDVAIWTNIHLTQYLADNCTIVLTCRFGWRNNHFMAHAERRFMTRYRVLAEEVTTETSSRHENEIIPLLVFLSAIRDYTANITALRYRDFVDPVQGNAEGWGLPMMLYRLDNVRRRDGEIPTNLPLFDELMEGYIVTSEGAKKAWVTRRQRAAEKAAVLRVPDEDIARFKRNSDRGLKAWQTRRAKARERAKETETT